MPMVVQTKMKKSHIDDILELYSDNSSIKLQLPSWYEVLSYYIF